MQVLLRDTSLSGGLYATTLDQINDEDYILKGWYDDQGFPAGGRIRIIVATPQVIAPRKSKAQRPLTQAVRPAPGALL